MDFHLGPEDDPDSRDPRDLFIDVLIELPELADGTATAETVAPSFRHMQLESDDRRTGVPPSSRGAMGRRRHRRG